MSRTYEVITPEQVAIRFELAGFGSRAIAAMIDTCVLALILIVIYLLAMFSAVSILHRDSPMSFDEQLKSSVFVGIAIFVIFVVTWGYHIAFETLWNGSTPGKRVMSIRVMKDGGHPIDFRSVVIRNLIRPVDGLFAYGLAFVTMLCNPEYKRLGDLAAGTFVVRQGGDTEKDLGFSFGATVVFRLLDTETMSKLSRLSRDEFRLAQRFLERRGKLPQPLRGEFAHRLALPLMEKLEYTPSPLGVDYERWLDELDLAYRTRTIGSPTAAAASPPNPAVSSPIILPTEHTSDPDERKW